MGTKKQQTKSDRVASVRVVQTGRSVSADPAKWNDLFKLVNPVERGIGLIAIIANCALLGTIAFLPPDKRLWGFLAFVCVLIASLLGVIYRVICEMGYVFELAGGEVVNDRYIVATRQERFG